MSKQRIIEGIDAMFQSMRTPSPLMHAVERQVCIQNREREHAWIKREVSRVFEQRNELLAACKACAAVLGSMDTLRHIAPEFSALDLARAAIAKAEGGQDE